MGNVKRWLGAPVRAVRWLVTHEPVITAAAVGVVVNTVADQVQAGADFQTMKRNLALAVLAFGMRLRVTPTGKVVLTDPAPAAAPAPTPYVVGETGPELFIPTNGGKVLPGPRSFLSGEYRVAEDGFPDTGAHRFHP